MTNEIFLEETIKRIKELSLKLRNVTERDVYGEFPFNHVKLGTELIISFDNEENNDRI